ncbi:cubilin-like [Dermacentor albipictus]|uniref:cubilin-like n=1 Tax=Dermacentor albipictus TaxID=60249 RepID=UPI0031FBEBA9
MAALSGHKRTLPLLVSVFVQLCVCAPDDESGGTTAPMLPETTTMLLGSTTFEITEMTVEEVPTGSTASDITTTAMTATERTSSTTAEVTEASTEEVTEGIGATETVSSSSSATTAPSTLSDDGSAQTTTPMSTRRATLELSLGDMDPPGLLLPFPLLPPNRTEPWFKNQADSRLVHQGVCDYCLFDGEGNFTSYGYPLDYPPLLECTYRVKRVGGACSLQVRFHDFDLEESPGCRNDYLAVADKRFCGRRRYRGHTEIVDFPKESDEVTFYLHTNPLVSGKGFWIEVNRRPGFCDTRKNVVGPCEERHSHEEFQLWSPGFPESYASNQKCWYYIRRATDAVCGLELTFLHFELEQSDSCIYDYLDVDGQKLCGSITPGAVRVFMFNRDQLLMHFSSDSQNNKRGFHIKARQITACYPGSVLPPPPLCDMCTDRLSDDITSYGFPTAYRGNMLCRVTISRPSDAFCAVEMHFREFDVEKSSRCDRDFLQIDRDRYCGTMLKGQRKRMVYDTEGNAVMVFKTDESVSGKGFHVRFHQVPCGAAHRDPVATAATTTTAASGILPPGPPKEVLRCDQRFDKQREFYVQSPNYPSHYLDNQDCRYVITKAGEGVCHLELVFASFDIESSPGCQYDYLEFGGQRHCGSLPADHSYVIPFLGSDMVLHFHSNVATTRRGFSVRARQIKCALGTSPAPPPPSQLQGPPGSSHPDYGAGDSKSQGVVVTTTMPVRITTPYGPVPVSSTTGEPYITRRSCDIYMDKMEFELESTNYPADYEDGTDCVYTVRRAHGNICQMEITFLDFQLQPSDSCQGDYLAIDGTRVCGTVVPGTVRLMDFREPQKVMRFHTDDSQSDRGFHIAVRQNECDEPASTPGGGAVPAGDEEGECDETIHKPEAMLLSANYPANYGNNLDCRYTVRKMSSSVCRLEMNFERFDVESSTDCEYDYLDVDGQRLCGIFSRNTSGMYDFEENEKQLHFHSDAANSRPGFRIRLRQVECVDEDEAQSPRPPPFRPLQGGFTTSTLGVGGDGHHREHHKCDKILTNRLFDVRSPNYPGGYPPNLDCKYIVFQASRDICSVEFTFIDFDVDKDNECFSDFLEIDGERVCGVLPPGSKRLVHFSSSQMVFRFRSDQGGSRPGFHIKSRQVECGSRLPPVTGLEKAPVLGVPCMYEFCDQSGVFYSQGFPGPYPNQMSCTYRIIAAAPDRCRVELSFIQFNLHSNNRPDDQCGADFMEINGVRYCNRQLEGQIRILDFKGPRRSVTMHFISNEHDAGKGFLGFYKQLGCPTGEGGDGRPPASLGGGPPELYHPKPYPHPSDSLDVATKRQQHQHQPPSCDRLYALEEFELESPGYPGPYRPGLDCRYFIRRHSEAVCALLVTFDAFDLEYSAGCHHDYLELAGHKICGQVPAGKTKQLPLRDFQTAFRFHSNEAIENRGFMLRVRQVACGDDGGSLFDRGSSPPQYPHHPALGAGAPPPAGGHPLGPAMFAPSGDPAFYPPSRGLAGGAPPLALGSPVLGGAPLGPPSYPLPPPPSPHGGGSGRGQCDRALNQPYFELRSADLGTGDRDCRFIVRRRGVDQCRLELLFVRFDVDCNQDQFRVQDVQICGRLDHYTTRTYDFEGPELYLYYHTRSGGRASDFLIKGRQKGCAEAGSGTPPASFPGGPLGPPVSGRDISHPRHQGPPSYPPPSPPVGYPPPPSVPGPPPSGGSGRDPHALPPRYHPQPPSHLVGGMGGYPPSAHYPPTSLHTSGGGEHPPSVPYGPPSHYPAPPSHYAPPQPAPAPYYPPQPPPPGGPHAPRGGYRPDHHSGGGHYGHPPAHQGPPVDRPPQGPPPPGMPWSPPSSGRPEWSPRDTGPGSQPAGYPPASPHGRPPGTGAAVPYPRPGPGQGPARPAGDCDQTFTALEMTVQSPNFPGPYPARTICRYVVRRYDSATCALEVLFIRFDMEHNPDCQYEHLEVDGRKLCGTLPENSVQKFSFYQPETEKVLVFRSDQGSPRQGFSIRIRQVTDCAGASSWMPGQDKVPPVPPNPLCDYCQREPRGQLSSPNYPQPYGPNARCTYRLEPVPGHCHVEMYFHHFDVESSPGCMKDYLEVDKTQRHCGNDLNKAIRKFPFPDGPSPEIRILFMTDGYGGGKGFHLEYRQLPCKSGQPANGDGGHNGQGPGPGDGEGGNGSPVGTSAVASSDRKLHWVKGFREKPGLVTASIFVENRGNATTSDRFLLDNKKAS